MKRTAALSLILFLSACATTQVIAPPEAVTRADSLRSLPAESLTPSDSMWLAEYHRAYRPRKPDMLLPGMMITTLFVVLTYVAISGAINSR